MFVLCCVTFCISAGIVHFVPPPSLLSPFLVEPDSVATPGPPSSLYTLLLLMPLVAAAAATTACVLLWRQRHSSDGGESSGVSPALTALPVPSVSGAPVGCQLSDAGRDNLWGCCNEPAPAGCQFWGGGGHTRFTPLSLPSSLPGIERSLSVRAAEAENIYEDPDSVRQVTNLDAFKWPMSF